MKKTINTTIYVIVVASALFNIAEATQGGAMGFAPFYDSTICYNNQGSKASYQKRPAINKDNAQLQTTIQEDLRSAKNDTHTAPKQNQEDKVIEFIVSDVSGF